MVDESQMKIFSADNLLSEENAKIRFRFCHGKGNMHPLSTHLFLAKLNLLSFFSSSTFPSPMIIVERKRETEC